MRNVVQIGLATIADYIFLTSENWVDYLEWRYRRTLPYFIYKLFDEDLKADSSPFRYFGIDFSPSSISNLSKEHLDNEHACFICVGIGSDYGVIRKTPEREHFDKYNEFYGNNTCVIVPFNFLIDHLNLKSIDIFAVDVDGYEMALFRTFDCWKIKPDRITVEVHSKKKIRRVDSQFFENVDFDKCDKYPIDHLSNYIVPHGYTVNVFPKHNDPDRVHEVLFWRV